MKSFPLVLLLLATDASAAPPIPDTPAGRALTEFLAAYNAGDRAGLAALYKKYHRDRPVETALSNRHRDGGLTILRVEKSESGSIDVLVEARDTEDTFRFGVDVDPADPTAHLDTRLSDAPRPPEFAPPRLSSKAALDALSARADAMTAQDKFSGTVLVAVKDEVVFEKTWGFSDREKRTPVTTNTKFRFGSMGKMFTAVAVLQLVAQGRVSLDERVGRYLPDYPNKDVAQKVTIRELLIHTGGVGDIFGPEFWTHRLELKTLHDYVALYGNRAPEHEPGAVDGYDNYGFILLGVILEKVSGQSYYDYVHDHIFAPLHMNDTGFVPEGDHVAGLAPGYTWKDGAWVSNADTLPWRGTSAGGGYSTVEDLLKFAQALEGNTLLPKALEAEALKPQNHAGWSGYGFSLRTDPPAPYYGHSGGAPGMNGELRIYPGQGVVFIGLGNLDGPGTGSTILANFHRLRMPLAP